jgi:hypothetical protein
VGPAEVATFAVELVYRPPGCTGSDGWLIRPDSPVVTVSSLWISGERAHVGESFGLRCLRR